MPTYDYKCISCENKFEYFQKMTDKPITECSKCGGKVKRIIGAGLTPIFKGSGFYETDYKTKKKSSPQKDKKSVVANSEIKKQETAKKTKTA